MIDHFGFPVADLDRSLGFSLGVFSPLGLLEASWISHPSYDAVVRRDPDGHNVEAVTHSGPID